MTQCRSDPVTQRQNDGETTLAFHRRRRVSTELGRNLVLGGLLELLLELLDLLQQERVLLHLAQVLLLVDVALLLHLALQRGHGPGEPIEHARKLS